MPDERTCRVCGCSEENACVNTDGEACAWVEPDLCSACGDSGGPQSVEEVACAWGLQGMLDEARKEAAFAKCEITPELEDLLSDFWAAGWSGHALFVRLEADQALDAFSVPVQPKILLPGQDF